MTITLSIRLAGLLAIIISAVSCTHQNADTPAPTPALLVTATNSTTVSPTVVPLTYAPAPPTRNQPEYIFDWENAPYVPNPAGVTPIPTSWNDQAKRAFSDDIRYDYKKADGWVMLYNPFTSQFTASAPILVLYNKYRGLLRYYFYTQLGTQNLQGNNTTAQLIETYGAGATASPLLNFAEQTVVDLAKTSRSYSTLEPQPISDNTWYVAQTELAYDSQLPKQSYETFYVHVSLNSDKVTAVTLNGGTPGTALPVGLHIEGVRFFSTSQSTYTGTAQLLINGANGIRNLQTAGQDVSAVNNSLMQTTAGNLYSGVLTAQNTTSSSVLPASIPVQLTKPVGNAALLTAPSFALPGYDNSKTSNIGPQYNEAPGVFYLDSKPVITAQTSASTNAYTYTLDVASVRYLFNPAVTNLADIKNIKQEIVATAIAPAESTLSATPTLYSGTALSANQPLAIVGVRVSFDVVPRSGASPVRIIKTFKADMKNQ